MARNSPSSNCVFSNAKTERNNRSAERGQITVAARSDSAESEVPVSYSGPIEFIQPTHERADIGFLLWSLRSVIQKNGLSGSVSVVGEYSRWAE
jgi:hypothetical protein